MATGETHEIAGIGGVELVILASIALQEQQIGDPSFHWALIAGAAAGWMWDPDVRDLHNITTRGERRWNRIPLIGAILAYLNEIIWYPLARLIPHRGWASHLPGIATLIALAWVGIIPLFLLGRLNWEILSNPIFWGIFLGWSFLDFIHLAWDGFGIRW